MRRLTEPPPSMPTNIPLHLMAGRATRRPDRRHLKAQPLKIDLRFKEDGAQIFARNALSVRTGSAPALRPMRAIDGPLATLPHRPWALPRMPLETCCSTPVRNDNAKLARIGRIVRFVAWDAAIGAGVRRWSGPLGHPAALR